MTHQLNIILLLFGAMQGLLLGAWLLWNKPKPVSNLYLVILLLVVGLQLTFKVITKVWVMDFALIPYLMSYKLPYLMGPLIFLFSRSQREKNWCWRDLLHCIPFLIFVAIAIFKKGTQPHAYTQVALQTISLCTYTWLSLRLKHDNVRQFVILVASAEFVIILTLGVMYVYNGQFPDVRMLFVVLTLLIYWISYKTLSRAAFIFPGDVPVMALQSQKTAKYAKSSLKQEEADRIERELSAIMIDNKLFADASLTIDILAVRLHTSRHHLSQVINERLHKSYADYIGDLRLEEARRRLIDPANFRYTIAGIAMDAGFNSVSTFNDTFKKQYRTTPSKYRDQVLKEKSA